MTSEQMKSENENSTSNAAAAGSLPLNPTDTTATPLPSSQKTLSKNQLKRRTDPSRMCVVPKPGFTWNPLLKLPRNMPCPCGSPKKFKACHLEKLDKIVKQAVADEYTKAITSGRPFRFVEDVPTEVVKEFAVTADKDGKADVSTAREVGAS